MERTHETAPHKHRRSTSTREFPPTQLFVSILSFIRYICLSPIILYSHIGNPFISVIIYLYILIFTWRYISRSPHCHPSSARGVESGWLVHLCVWEITRSHLLLPRRRKDSRMRYRFAETYTSCSSLHPSFQFLLLFLLPFQYHEVRRIADVSPGPLLKSEVVNTQESIYLTKQFSNKPPTVWYILLFRI